MAKAGSPPGKIAIAIEPGMAFGTGQHATTKLCLLMLEQLALVKHKNQQKSCQIFDIGTGSGILSIAAAKLFATVPHAVDIDQDSVIATRRNAEENNVDMDVQLGSIDKFLPSINPVDGEIRVVLANILKVVLEPMLAKLTRLTGQNGYLIMSGILEEEVTEMQDQLKKHDFEISHKQTLDGWAALKCRHQRKDT